MPCLYVFFRQLQGWCLKHALVFDHGCCLACLFSAAFGAWVELKFHKWQKWRLVNAWSSSLSHLCWCKLFKLAVHSRFPVPDLLTPRTAGQELGAVWVAPALQGSTFCLCLLCWVPSPLASRRRSGLCSWNIPNAAINNPILLCVKSLKLSLIWVPAVQQLLFLPGTF